MSRHFRPSGTFGFDCCISNVIPTTKYDKNQLVSWVSPSSAKRGCFRFGKKSIKELLNTMGKNQTKKRLISQEEKPCSSSIDILKGQESRQNKKNQVSFKSAIIGYSPTLHCDELNHKKQCNVRQKDQPKITFNLYQSDLGNLSTHDTCLNDLSHKPFVKAQEKRKRSSRAKQQSMQASSQIKSQFVSVKYNESSSFIFQNKNKDSQLQSPKFVRLNTLDPKLIQSQVGSDCDQGSDQMSQVLMHYSPSFENPQTSDSPISPLGFEASAQKWSQFLGKKIDQ